ncbi:MAG: hypothetical protein II200_00235 [Bacteroidaceae bacterium]|nr:hypothetical protein [Bacteroidaceae bacterium]
MKKFWSFMVVALVGMGVGFTSCSDDDEETTGGGNGTTPPAPASAVVEALESGAITSADFVLEATSISEMAYKAVKAADDTVNAGVMSSDLLFANADAVVAVKDGKDTITVAGLEGNTAYNIYVAVKTLDGEFLNEVADIISVTTANYGDQLITMIDIKANSIKFHVNMPDTADWLLLLGDRGNYEQMKMYFGQSDAGFLESIGNIHYKGPQTIEIKDGDYWYTETDWDGTPMYDMEYVVKPGSAFVMMIAAAHYAQVPNVWPETWRWIPYYEMTGGGDDWIDDDMGVWSNSRFSADLLGDYTETCTDESVTFTHEYAKQYFWTAPAAAPAEGEGVEVTLKKLTERTAIFEMVPSEDCLSYHVLPLSHEDYEMLCMFVGEAGMQAYVLNNGEPMTGGNEYVMNGLEIGATYHMMVTGLFEENGAVQTYYHETFSPQESTLPTPEMEITAVPEKNTHDKVYFNLKCTTKDAWNIKYIANYVKDWIPELNSGYSYEDMVEMYGQEFTEEELQQVNSEEGYEIFYTTYEDVATRLAVIAYNEDEKASKAFWADSQASALPAKDKISSSIYADIAGNWELNYWDTYNYYEKYSKTGEARKFNTVITQNPDFGPATFEEWKNDATYEVVLAALNNDEAKVKALFDDYKATAAYYQAKYESQNQMVGFNFPAGMYVKAADQKIYGPWDLFTSEYYSAYDCHELFYDFGPKVMFEVVGENELVLKSDMNAFPPLANFDSSYYMVGIGMFEGQNQYLMACEFPVTISENKDTLTVHPCEYEGVLYYPATISYNWGYANPQNITDKEVTYVRSTSNMPVETKPFSIDDVLKANRAVYNSNELVPVSMASHVKRNAKVKALPKFNRVEGKLFDLEAQIKSLKK